LSYLNNLPLGLYEKAVCQSLPWEKKLTLARESGFDYFEMSVDTTPERLARLTSREEILEIRRAVESTNCPIYTMALTVNRTYPAGSLDAAVRDAGQKLVQQGICFAAEVGIRVVHLAGYDEHMPRCSRETERRFTESMAEYAAFAARYGVILAVETMETEYMGSCKNIARLVRELDSPYFQCYADIGNLTARGVDLAADIPEGGSHIVGIHLKDARPGICRDVPFGEGIVDFQRALAILNDIHYSGFFAAEMWCYEHPEFHGYLPEVCAFLRCEISKI